jgi:hypothetical protein
MAMLTLAATLWPCVSASVGDGLLRATHQAVLPYHISALMSLYMNADLNAEWNDRLWKQAFVESPEHGRLVHQTYKLPWPLKPRDMLMECHHHVDAAAYSVSTKCNSRETVAVPIKLDVVRMEIVESLMHFEALPGGDATRVTSTVIVNERFAVGVPTLVTKYVQVRTCIAQPSLPLATLSPRP